MKNKKAPASAARVSEAKNQPIAKTPKVAVQQNGEVQPSKKHIDRSDPSPAPRKTPRKKTE